MWVIKVWSGPHRSMLVYMCSSLLHLAPGSRDLSQAVNKISVTKQIHKIALKIVRDEKCCMSFLMKIVVILWICSALQTVILFSAWDK